MDFYLDNAFEAAYEIQAHAYYSVAELMAEREAGEELDFPEEEWPEDDDETEEEWLERHREW